MEPRKTGGRRFTARVATSIALMALAGVICYARYVFLLAFAGLLLPMCVMGVVSSIVLIRMLYLDEEPRHHE